MTVLYFNKSGGGLWKEEFFLWKVYAMISQVVGPTFSEMQKNKNISVLQKSTGFFPQEKRFSGCQ